MKDERKKIMVMGAGGTAGINFIECLRMSKERYYIIACDINKWHLKLPDADKRYIVPYSLEPTYIDAINGIAVKEQAHFIHAQPDMEVEVLSEKREQLVLNYFLPSKETVRICRDKMVTNEVLSKKGVPAPLSFRIDRIEDLKEMMKTLKEKSLLDRVWIRAIKGAGSKAALPVKSFRQAKEWIHYWRSTKRLESKDFMISEFLPGREYAFQSLWHKGELIVSQARERIEYLMGNLFPSGQSSSPSVAITVHNEAVNNVAIRAVKAIDENASGIFCIDIKENASGIPCITEINCGRFFTTMNFFAKMGCNMVDYYIKLGFGEKLDNLPNTNALPKDYIWIRSIDKSPILIKKEEIDYFYASQKSD